jgi:hypothetical protein
MSNSPEHSDSAETLLKKILAVLVDQAFVVTVADFAALPNPGESGIIYITGDDSRPWVWNGSEYVEAAPVRSVNGFTGVVSTQILVANFAALPEEGVPGVIYITADTNVPYRWTGSIFAPLSPVQSVNGQTGVVVIGSTGGGGGVDLQDVWAQTH